MCTEPTPSTYRHRQLELMQGLAKGRRNECIGHHNRVQRMIYHCITVTGRGSSSFCTRTSWSIVPVHSNNVVHTVGCVVVQSISSLLCTRRRLHAV